MGNILSILEETAERFPDKKALGCRDSSLSFFEVISGAKKYAHKIHSSIDKGTIGVFINRDIFSVVALLGVLYSGNIYVPLDPDMPAEKLDMIIKDAGLIAVLVDEANIEKLNQTGFNGEIINRSLEVQTEYSDLTKEANDPAYIVYTSGSTGKPKGVLKSHGSLISFIDAYQNEFAFSNEDIIGNQTPFFFDAAIKDLLVMIKTGATLEIIPTELFSTTTTLIEYMNEKKISFCSWVPTALSLVAQMCPFEYVKPQYLKKMYFVGEVMPMKHLNVWRENLINVEYVNLYGQSELAGVCCYYRVEKQFENDATLPMGRTLSNCKIYLCDGDNIINEPGKIGEIYLVSDALAMEYYNDTEKTSASFLVRDFGEGPIRCFKTGDLATYDTEGNLLFASRSDYQIKHQGRRIELGEIEAYAGSIEEIGRCCCLYDNIKKKIVLFCELSSGVNASASDIKIKLRSVITSYMLPNKVVIMEKLPLNPNGKIDRQKLKESL